MSNDVLNNLEISEECLDSLRRTYSIENNRRVDDCSMSELAIAFAAGELQSAENQDFSNHLHTCNFCLNLVLDLKVAERDSTANFNRTPKVLPGLAKATRVDKSTTGADSVINKLRSLVFKYCSQLLSPKFIAVAVTACLAFIVFNFGLNDPEISEKLGEFNKRPLPTEDSQKQAPETKHDFSTNQNFQKEPIEQNEPVNKKTKAYNPTGKMDPFEDPFRNRSHAVAKKKIRRVPRTPLERIDLSQLKVVGIVLSENGNKALLEESTGKGYVIIKDSYIGTKGGKVIEIEKDRVIIEEKFEDEFGNIKSKKIELKLQK